MIRHFIKFAAIASTICLGSCGWDNQDEMLISDSASQGGPNVMAHNNRPIKIEFDKNMLIAMDLPLHEAKRKVQEAMPQNALLPIDQWTIDHWKQRIRVTSFADIAYADGGTSISMKEYNPPAQVVTETAEVVPVSE